MKKAMTCLTALIVLAALMQSCSPNSSQKFLGKWKRIDKPDKDTIIIVKEAEDIVILKGKDTLTVRPDHNTLKVYCLSTTVIVYVEKTGHLIISKGEDGEYEKLP